MLDRNSATWLTLRKQIDKQINSLRDDLEQRDMPPDHIRGEIAGLRWVKEQVEPASPITEPTGSDYSTSGIADPT